jgi:hypothetical protein
VPYELTVDSGAFHVVVVDADQSVGLPLRRRRTAHGHTRPAHYRPACRRRQLGPNDVYVVARGVERRPTTDGEVLAALFARKGTVNTGDAGGQPARTQDVEMSSRIVPTLRAPTADRSTAPCGASPTAPRPPDPVSPPFQTRPAMRVGTSSTDDDFAQLRPRDIPRPQASRRALIAGPAGAKGLSGLSTAWVDDGSRTAASSRHAGDHRGLDRTIRTDRRHRRRTAESPVASRSPSRCGRWSSRDAHRRYRDTPRRVRRPRRPHRAARLGSFPPSFRRR